MAPPGKQPPHKPSPRHTLQEVLRSLQDMIRNELAEVQARPVEPPTPPAPPIRTPADIEAGLSQVLTVLPPETGAPADAAPPETPPAPFAAIESAPLGLAPSPPAAPSPAVQAPPAATAEKLPHPTDRQLELPIFEPAAPGEFAVEVIEAAPAAEPLETPPAEPIEATPPVEPLETPPVKPIEAAAPEPPATASAPAPDDIPVLRDAVFVPPTAPPPPPETPALPLQTEIPLPSPDNAREIAIQVAARLNVELKKSGRRGLSSEAILRLTQLLRDALAQAAANVDNTPQQDRATDR